MATRRVRRDSETSTDSWSLVEEDHLEDDISMNSTDIEENEEDVEPIIEEPPTSDEEDTASEKSLNSDSESEDSDSSDCDSNSDSESDSDSEVDEAQLTASESEGEEEEEAEDSDLEVQIQKEKEEEEEEEEDEEEMSEEEKEAVRKCKEEDWYHEEEEEEEDQEAEISRFRAVPFFISMTLMFGFFVAADRYTAYLVQQHFDAPKVALYDDDYSQQSYNSKRVGRFGVEEKKIVKYDYRGRPLEDTYKPVVVIPEDEWFKPYANNYNNYFSKYRSTRAESSNATKTLTLPVDTTIPVASLPTKTIFFNQTTEIPEWKKDMLKSLGFFAMTPKSSLKSLAPVPPAPFTPRRQQKKWMPRHQPCLVHVNESKWTCQKNVPAVIYSHSQGHLVKKWKQSGRSSGAQKMQKGQKIEKQICGKKASQSMRTISKPTDQCESRHFSKYTPRRKHIAYKTPLPCQAPPYKPSSPKPTKKPSQSEDWYSKRTQARAQLRSRA